jgi:hypothetical protein
VPLVRAAGAACTGSSPGVSTIPSATSPSSAATFKTVLRFCTIAPNSTRGD